MKIEVLFPEICNLYGDLQNIEYLKKCSEEIEIISTSLHSSPAFLKDEIALVYMGSTTEDGLKLSIESLLPYKEEILKKIEEGQHFLFTGNALDILGKEIASDFYPDTPLVGLSLLDTKTNYTMMNRHNSFFLGTFEDMKIVGFKSQFGHTNGNVQNDGLFSVTRGVGRTPGCPWEGFRYKNLYATYLLGPLLILNPPFTKYLLRELGWKDTLAFEEAAFASYNQRCQEFGEENRNFIYT